MIAKIIKSGASFTGTINYLLDEKKTSKNGETPKIIAIDGVSEFSTNAMAIDFERQASMNERVKNTVGHISLSFHNDDNVRLSDEFMKELAKEYMEKMKIVNTPYAVVRHYDSSNPHCHILYSRVNNQGKVISDSNDRHRSVEISRAMEKKHDLTYSEEKKNVNREKLKGADAIKYEIYDAIKECLPKCKNWEELILNLSEYDVGLFFKYKGGTNIKEGVVFEKDDKVFAGSKIDRKFSFANFEKSFSQTHVEKQSEKHSLTQEVNISTVQDDTIGAALDIVGGSFENVSGGANDISRGRRNEVVDDEEERKKRKKKKRIIYRPS